MFRILQLTDLHVFAHSNECLKGIPTRESLSDVVHHIQKTEPPPDLVVVTGDHTHDELRASYDAVAEILSPWRDCLRQVPGNHDDRELIRTVFPDRMQETVPEAVQFNTEAEDWLLLGLDSHCPGAVDGEITGERLEWAARAIRNSSRSQVMVFQHHPPIDVDSDWMDKIGLRTPESYAEFVGLHSGIQRIVCGHVHHEWQGQLHQAAVNTTPSTGIQFDPNGSKPTFAAAAPGYRIIELDGPSVTTSVVRLPEIRYTPSV